ncbi:Mu transposase C-terminal domain-containing protein [Amycolatopsis magusensis]|uniref:Mu transposase C-terminal domain-containing protein n=1 Tax=Amycolatopsis magusensis TaxID=882444 RepID=UPI0024A7B076|nr:Mu transposase C-terminal domain-containing protein [Amycolatopsis magusensis]MDI5975854.1 Mu transposase C-terminal domain-containing protein [Amycolatopsis magusensis]
MTVSRPRVLQAGDDIQLGGELHNVEAVSSTAVRLVNVVGTVSVVPLVDVLSDPSLALASSARDAAPLPPSGLLDGLAEPVAAQARWWERHIVEILTGLPPDHAPAATAKPEYDPNRASLRQRELAKIAELTAAGHQVSFTNLKRLRLAYEKEGLWGLVDQRTARRSRPTGRVDDRVVAATLQAITEETDRSTGTVSRLRRKVTQILAADHGDEAPVLPSPATFYRLVNRLSQGKHTFGSARTRRSVAKPPDGPFGSVTAVRPGEWMQIDSTPIDVRVVLDTGVVDRAELTWIVDLATRTIPAAVLRPTTKAADAAVLLARTLTPEPMRPGWVDALRMSRSVLPHRRLTEIDDRLEHAAARPVIVPESIVCDHGKAYISRTFQSACRAMGINFQPTHKGSPWEKGTVETSFNAVGTLFAQYVAGYVGSSVERRGEKAEQDAVWSIVELQALLDEWIVTTWQNRPHAGLRHPVTPDKSLTPNEQYAALVEVAGYVPVPLSADDFVELLPVSWNAINKYGIKLNKRTYDCKALNPYRRQHSGVERKKGLWEVHSDPYDVTRIWVRNHHGGGWITVPWKHLRSTPVPFGELAWQHARSVLSQRGEDAATEGEIAAAAAALLDKAEQGPDGESTLTKRDRRVAGRTRATSTPSGPRPPSSPGEEPDFELPSQHPDEHDEADEPVAKVIPLPVFDARKEAEQWRF